MTVYDYETRSMIQTDTDIAAKSSYDTLITNADGSIDLYFGPTARRAKTLAAAVPATTGKTD